MNRWGAVLILVVACHAPQPSPSDATTAVRTGIRTVPAETKTALAIHILGAVDPDSMPPSCRAHSGTPPVRSFPPALALSTARDRRLDSLGAGHLLVHVISARTGQPFGSAAILLEPALARRSLIGIAPDGWARVEAPAGRYRMRVRAIAAGDARLDSIDIRRGYVDTLKLAVGQPWICGL
jgi:hypothetical protein